MTSFARKFAWIFAITVVVLFLFPLSSGSFTATHGPTTALRAWARVAALYAAMLAYFSAAISLIVLRYLSGERVAVLPALSSNSSSQLRC